MNTRLDTRIDIADPGATPIQAEGAGRRNRIIGWILAGMAALLALGYAAMPEFAADMDGDDGPVMLVLCVAGCAWGAWKFLRPGAATAEMVLADAHGVTVTTADRAIGPVRWDEIAAIEVKSMKGIQYLGFELYEPAETMARFGKANRLAALAVPFIGGSPMMIPAYMIEGSIYRLRDRLQAALAAHRTHTAGA